MSKLGVEEYLKQYSSESTRRTCRAGLRKYLKSIQPTLKNEDLDTFSLEYVSGNPDIRKDLIAFRTEAING
jgi:hypothetical protein